MDDAGHVLAAGQEVGDRQALRLCSRMRSAQRLDALHEQEGVERRHRRAEVAQQGDAHLQDVGDRAERLDRLGPDRAVIGGVGRVQRRLARRVRLPVEIAAVDDDAADRGAVAADILGGRIDHHRRAVIERAAPAAARRCCP